MGEIGPILKGIARRANPLAFVAYIVAIGAWVFLRHRVDRNNNLLKRLTVLPKEDRLDALKAEMGTVPLKKGSALNSGFVPELIFIISSVS